MINNLSAIRWFRACTGRFYIAFFAAMTGLLFFTDSSAAKSGIMVEFKIDNALSSSLKYTPDDQFRKAITAQVCELGSQNWAFLNWCCKPEQCESGECEPENCETGHQKAVWTVMLSKKDDENGVTWLLKHLVNSSEIEPVSWNQDVLYGWWEGKPVSSGNRDKDNLRKKIKETIKKQFGKEAFKDKAEQLLLAKIPVANELVIFKNAEGRETLTLPFRHCDLKLHKAEVPDDTPVFTVMLNYGDGITNNYFRLKEFGEVTPKQGEDEKLKGHIMGKVTYLEIDSLGKKDDTNIIDIRDTPFLVGVIEKVDKVLMKNYDFDSTPCSFSSETGLVLSDPANMVSAQGGDQP